MSGYSNTTYDELAVGATVSAQRMLGQSEIEALMLVSGDVVPFHVAEGADPATNTLSVDAVAAEAIIAGMLERRLPGPVTRIVSQQFEFLGYLRAGDQVKATVTVLEKLETPRRVVFECVV